MKRNLIAGVAAIFLLFTVIFFSLSIYVAGFHFIPLEIANGIMALLSFITWVLVNNNTDKSQHAFVRAVSGASFMKLMVCMVAVLAYVLLNRVNVHKPTVYLFLVIYGIYMAYETTVLFKTVKVSGTGSENI